MSTSETFKQQVETYLAATGMDATSFGRASMNDPCFVSDLRKGRNPTLKTMDRVVEFMHSNPPDEKVAV